MCRNMRNRTSRNIWNQPDYIVLLGAVCLLALAACGDRAKGKGGGEADSLSVAAVSASAASVDEGKYTQEYITRRIDSVYQYCQRFWANERRGMKAPDQLFCSSRYLQLDAEAMRLSETKGIPYVDGDHWAVGQDLAPDWRYRLSRVYDVTDSTAMVELRIHNFSDEQVELRLLFERGDWYVDNFYFYYMDSDRDEAGNEIPGTMSRRQLDEVADIHRFIREYGEETASNE